MGDDTVLRRAAYALYVSLHGLAAAHVLGTVETEFEAGDVIAGDIDDVLLQLNEYGTVLSRVRPGLVEEVRDIVAHWGEGPAERFTELLPVLDSLAEIAGVFLPLVLPPAP